MELWSYRVIELSRVFLYAVDILFHLEWCIRLIALVFFYRTL